MSASLVLSLVLGAAAAVPTAAPAVPEAVAPAEPTAPATVGFEEIDALMPRELAELPPDAPEKGPAAAPAASAVRGSGAALGPGGHEGALGTVSPFLRGPLKFQVAAGGGYYTGSGLVIPGADDTFAQGRAALAFGLTDWLSLGGSFSGFSFDDSHTAGNAMAVGDFGVGVVAAVRHGPFAGGGFLDVRVLPAVGGFGAAGVGAVLGLTGGAEFQKIGVGALQVTANVAYHLDDVGGYKGMAWDDVTRLGYQAFRYPRLETGAVVLWGTSYVSPMLEVRSHFMTFAPPEAKLPPFYLTPGVRITPTDRIAIDVSARVGFNAGLVPGSPATLPWLAQAAISYELEPFRTVEVVHEVMKELPRGTIRGVVADKASGKPVGAAIITFASTRLTDLATHPTTGVFEANALEPGLYPIVVQKEGYEPEQTIVTVRANQPAEVSVKLKPQPLIGKFKGFVRDEKGTPLAATLLFPEAPTPVQPKEVSGTFEAELPPGRFRIEARSIGYLVQGRQIEVHQRETILYDFVLREVPATRVTVLTKSKIDISQVIQFEFGKARILPVSFYILDELVDVLLQHPEIAKVEIGGHSDNVGGAEANLKLSQARADSVRDFLIDKGISDKRLTAVGYGPGKPVAPNDNEGGRAKNRRVEFLILPGT